MFCLLNNACQESTAGTPCQKLKLPEEHMMRAQAQLPLEPAHCGCHHNERAKATSDVNITDEDSDVEVVEQKGS